MVQAKLKIINVHGWMFSHMLAIGVHEKVDLPQEHENALLTARLIPMVGCEEFPAQKSITQFTKHRK